MMFDIDQICTNDTIPIDKSGILVEKFLYIHYQRIKSLKDLCGRLPVEMEMIHLWTIKSFTAFTFIPYIIKYSGPIEEIYISTYSINIRVIDALVRLVDTGQVKQVVFFISDSIKSLQRKVYDHLRAIVENKPLRVIYAWNHSKIMAIKSGENYFNVTGSGNFSENAQHEQYNFSKSRKGYEFLKNEILYGIERRPD